MTGRELAALSGQENILVIRRPLVQWLGGIAAALLLDHLLYLASLPGNNGLFAVTDEELRAHLILGEKPLRHAREHLADLHLIEVVRRGAPARLYYGVNADRAAQLFSEHLAGEAELVTPNDVTGDVNRRRQSRQTTELSISKVVEGIRKVKERGTSPGVVNGVHQVHEALPGAAAELPDVPAAGRARRQRSAPKRQKWTPVVEWVAGMVFGEVHLDEQVYRLDGTPNADMVKFVKWLGVAVGTDIDAVIFFLQKYEEARRSDGKRYSPQYELTQLTQWADTPAGRAAIQWAQKEAPKRRELEEEATPTGQLSLLEATA